MSRFKCGIYIKREDWSKEAIRLIVLMSMFVSIGLPLIFASFFLLVHDLETLTVVYDIVNGTNVTLTDEQERILDRQPLIFPISLLILIIGITIFSFWVSSEIYKLLGLHEWNVRTCRCCGKKVGEHEKDDD